MIKRKLLFSEESILKIFEFWLRAKVESHDQQDFIKDLII